MDKLAQRIHDLSVKLLDGIGHAVKPEVSEMDPGVWLLDFQHLGLFIEAGVLCPVPSIVIKAPDRPGFRVGYWKTHPGNRETPPETEDVTEYQGYNLYEALNALGGLVVKDVIRSIVEAESQEF